MKITLKRTTLHGETDLAETTERHVRNHALVHPGWRSQEQLAELDRAREQAVDAALTDGRDGDHALLEQSPVPSVAYAANPARPPEPGEPVCHVVAVYTAEEGGTMRLEIETSDWETAEALGKRESIDLEL